MTFHSEEREKLLKISDITEWLNVSHSTIYDWIKKNDFPKPMVLGFPNNCLNTLLHSIDNCGVVDVGACYDGGGRCCDYNGDAGEFRVLCAAMLFVRGIALFVDGGGIDGGLF